MDVYGFVFDERNEDKIAAHGLTPQRVLQVLDNPYVVLPNRQGRRAPLLLIGQDNGGACIATPIEPTWDDGVWYPVTAWFCKDVESAHLFK